MAKGKKETKGRKAGLGMLSAIKDKPDKITAKQLGIVLGSYALGSTTGTFVGKYSAVAGLVIGGLGFFAKNLYITSLGAGMFFTAGARVATEKGLVGMEDEMEGFDMKEGTERVKDYFMTLGKRLYLPIGKKEETPATTTTEETPTSGLNGDEKVTYFINPYTQKPDKINLSDLDKVQSEIVEMAGTMGELEPGERNY